MDDDIISDEEMNHILSTQDNPAIEDDIISDEDMNIILSKQKAERKEFDRPFAAAGAAALRGATFGLSDVAFTETGLVNPKTLRGLQEHNPKASVAGEIGGIAGSIVAPIGGVVGIGAKTVSNLGTAITKKISSKIAADTSKTTVGKITKKALAAAGGSAVEGAFYGTGKVVSEGALGTPPENAQAVLADVGMSTLLGGGLGFLFKGAGEGVPIAYRKIADAAAPKFQNATNVVTNLYADLSSFVAGADREYTRKLFSTTAEGKTARENQIAFLTRQEELGRELVDALTEQHSAFKAGAKEFYDVKQDVERLIINNQVPVGKAIAGTNEIIRKNQDMITDMRKDPIAFPRNKVDKLEAELTRFYNTAKEYANDKKDSPRQLYKALEDYKKEIDKYRSYGKIESAFQQDFQNELKIMRAEVKNILEDHTIWGDAATRQKTINQAYNRVKTAEKPFMKNFGRDSTSDSGRVSKIIDGKRFNAYITKLHKQGGDPRKEIVDEYLSAMQDFADVAAVGEAGVINAAKTRSRETVEQELSDLNKFRQANWYNERNKGADTAVNALGIGGLVGGAIDPLTFGLGGAAYGIVRDPAKALRIMSFIEKSKDRTTKIISKNIKNFLTENTVKGLQTGIRVEAVSSIKDLIFNRDSMEEKREQWEKNSVKYSQLSQDPQMFQQEIADKLGPLAEVAPETAAALSANMAEALQMLSGAIPKMDDDNYLGFMPTIPPSDYEISEFANMERLIQSPLTLLDDLNKGTITIQNAAIVKGLYPDIYNQMVEAVTQEIIDNKVKLSYQKRMDLSVLLGRPLDSSMTPEFIQSMQQMHSPQTQQVMQQSQVNNAEFSGAQFAKGKAGKNIATPLQSSLGQ